MPARWSFEALAVEQFKNNKYEKNFFNYNLEISQDDWYSIFLIDKLKAEMSECRMLKDSLDYRQVVTADFYKLNYYIDKLNGLAGFGPISGNWKASLNIENFNSEVFKNAGRYIDSLAGRLRQVRKKYFDWKDSVNKSIEAKIGRDEFMKLQDDYSNTNLEDVVLNRLRVDKSIETARRIIQKYEPGYMKPTSKYGRSHFYAPYKQIGNTKIDTFWFNLLVLWIETLILYITLYYNLLQKLLDSLGNMNLHKSGV